MNIFKKVGIYCIYGFYKTGIGKKFRNRMNLHYAKKNSKNLKTCKLPKIYSKEETIRKIIDDEVSACRFNDLDFKIMSNTFEWSYQENDKELARELLDIIRSNDERVIICISPLTKWSVCNYGTKEEIDWWEITLGKYRNKWYRYLDFDKTYYAGDFNYCYNMYQPNIDEARKIHELLKKIWENKNVVMVEGKLTRAGIGNDYFDNVRSLRRILGPAKNAYSVKDKILTYIEKNIDKDCIILFALGPASKVMCYNLALKGYQAIDLGHFDLNYEYLLMGANKPVPIKNKYSNEATHLGGDKVSESIDDETYNKQIIAEIY